MLTMDIDDVTGIVTGRCTLVMLTVDVDDVSVVVAATCYCTMN